MNCVYIGLMTEVYIGKQIIIEINKKNYRRIEMGSGDWWSEPPDNVTNAVPVEFPIALEAWGTITHFGVFSKPKNLSGSEDLICCGKISEPKFVSKLDQPEFEIGSISITLEAIGFYDGKYKRRSQNDAESSRGSNRN